MTSGNSFPFISRRSTVYGVDGMVACSEPLATQVGVDILKKGGNAADAAIAVAATVNVVGPRGASVGGDAFCLFYDAKLRKVTGLNGSGRTPAKLTLDYIRNKAGIKGATIPDTSVHCATVPGAVAAWVDTVDRFGSGKLDMAAILQPAIDLAENGYPVTPFVAHAWKPEEKRLIETNNHKRNMLIDGIRAPKEGEIMYMPDLAKTLKAIAAHGKDGFYKGPIADAIVDALQSHGGLMTHDDLSSHTSEIVEPISIDYHGYTLWEIPPNGQGVTALIALGIIRALEEERGLDFSKIEHNSAEYLHIIIEALRIAFADTRYYVSDPQVGPTVSMEKLLSKEYLSQRAKLVDFKKRNNAIQKGYPEQQSNTVYFSVVDGEGNACSFIGSNFGGFGTYIVPENYGFSIHSRGCSFNLLKGHPNCVEPNKRPYHTILPTMLTRKDSSGDHNLEACFGIIGAYMQPQGHIQIVLSLLNYLTNPQHTLDLPRIFISASPEPEQANQNLQIVPFLNMNSCVVNLEEGIGPGVISQLRAMGHVCVSVKGGYERSLFGRGQIIRVIRKRNWGNDKNVLAAGSDPRADGQASPVVMGNSKL